ncbi:unnamed protein product [Arabis nemorensis]|uniref:Uncharacterized protein n=1 Tax=Arabis nemorensis TaxID=586526 RepID=A0A565CAT8_9BRAS|nr:unnamed protein product [Arabis nemorensis]
MKRHLIHNDFVLVFLAFIFAVDLGKGQNTTTQVINVGVVTDVGTTASNLSLLAINMSLSDFDSARPGFFLTLATPGTMLLALQPLKLERET